MKLNRALISGMVSSLLVLAMYIATLAHTIQHIDTGEIIAAQYNLGVAHPTGYPLFTILGYLFYKIPMGISLVLQANILAALLVASGVGVFTYVAYKLAEKSFPNLNYTYLTLVSVIGGLIFGLQKVVWEQATSIEVYSLHVLFLSLIFLAAVKILIITPQSKNNWLFASIIFALSFTNHLTTILAVPAFIYVLIITVKPKLYINTILLPFVVALFIVMGFYLYLPLSASQNPVLNWSNPQTIDWIIRHLTGSQFKVWMFNWREAAKPNFNTFTHGFVGYFGYVGFFIGLLGIGKLFAFNRKLFWVAIIWFVGCLIYSLQYSINDIESYFLLCYLSYSIFILFGFFYLISNIKNRLVAVLILAMIPITSIASNYKLNNKRDVVLFHQYAQQVLNSVEPNALIITQQWDYLVTQYYYYHFVEGNYKDIRVIDKELLRRSWYYHQLERQYPNIAKNQTRLIDKFIAELEPFEAGKKNFNANLLSQLYSDIIMGFISEGVASRPVYLGAEYAGVENGRGDFKLPKGFTLAPHGALLKVVPDTLKYSAANLSTQKIIFPKYSDPYTKFIAKALNVGYKQRAAYESYFGYADKASTYGKMADYYTRFLRNKK